MINVKGVPEHLVPAVLAAVRGIISEPLAADLRAQVTRAADGTWHVAIDPIDAPSLLPGGRFPFDPYDDLAEAVAATLQRAFPR